MHPLRMGARGCMVELMAYIQQQIRMNLNYLRFGTAAHCLDLGILAITLFCSGSWQIKTRLPNSLFDLGMNSGMLSAKLRLPN